jgi:hypothetical protein
MPFRLLVRSGRSILRRRRRCIGCTTSSTSGGTVRRHGSGAARGRSRTNRRRSTARRGGRTTCCRTALTHLAALHPGRAAAGRGAGSGSRGGARSRFTAAAGSAAATVTEEQEAGIRRRGRNDERQHGDHRRSPHSSHCPFSVNTGCDFSFSPPGKGAERRLPLQSVSEIESGSPVMAGGYSDCLVVRRTAPR